MTFHILIFWHCELIYCSTSSVNPFNYLPGSWGTHHNFSGFHFCCFCTFTVECSAIPNIVLMKKAVIKNLVSWKVNKQKKNLSLNQNKSLAKICSFKKWLYVKLIPCTQIAYTWPTVFSSMYFRICYLTWQDEYFPSSMFSSCHYRLKSGMPLQLLVLLHWHILAIPTLHG